MCPTLFAPGKLPNSGEVSFSQQLCSEFRLSAPDIILELTGYLARRRNSVGCVIILSFLLSVLCLLPSLFLLTNTLQDHQTIPTPCPLLTLQQPVVRQTTSESSSNKTVNAAAKTAAAAEADY